MMCYRDRTFCDFYKDCHKGGTCVRALTEEVQDAATAWWGGPNPPIMVFLDKPDCWKEKTNGMA